MAVAVQLCKRCVLPACLMYSRESHRTLHLNQVPRAGAVSMAFADELFRREMINLREAGTWFPQKILTTKSGCVIKVENSPTERILSFCSNDYLGMANHPELVTAGKEALESHGVGPSGGRHLCGTQDIHVQLEKKIAAFHGREDAAIYTSCFDANVGLFEALLGTDDAIISDALNHASIIDGIRLCKAKRYRFKTGDMEDLETQLKSAQNARLRLIATDGVFSMDGTLAKLGEISELAKKYNALIFLDECHATGIVGRTGRGIEERLGLEGRADIINSTFGKAVGGAAGGYTTGSKPLIELLRQRSRPYVFSNSVSPSAVAVASKAIDLILQSPELINSVSVKAKRFRTKMVEAGFSVMGDPDLPICPVMMGDARLSISFAEEMYRMGILVKSFAYPVVEFGKARIRVTISAAHSEQDIDTAIDAFVKIGRKFNVVK